MKFPFSLLKKLFFITGTEKEFETYYILELQESYILIIEGRL